MQVSELQNYTYEHRFEANGDDEVGELEASVYNATISPFFDIGVNLMLKKPARKIKNYFLLYYCDFITGVSIQNDSAKAFKIIQAGSNSSAKKTSGKMHNIFFGLDLGAYLYNDRNNFIKLGINTSIYTKTFANSVSQFYSKLFTVGPFISLGVQF